MRLLISVLSFLFACSSEHEVHPSFSDELVLQVSPISRHHNDRYLESAAFFRPAPHYPWGSELKE